MTKSGIERSQAFDAKFDPYVIMLRAKKLRDFAKYKYLNSAYLAYLIQKLAGERTELTIGQRKVFTFAMQNFIFQGIDPTDSLIKWNISYSTFEKFINSFVNYVTKVYVTLKQNAKFTSELNISYNNETIYSDFFILNQDLSFFNTLNVLSNLILAPEKIAIKLTITPSFNIAFLHFHKSNNFNLNCNFETVNGFSTQNLNYTNIISISITAQKV